MTMIAVTPVHVTAETPLYRITLTVAKFPHWEETFADVPLVLVRKGASPHTYEWPALIDLRTLRIGHEARDCEPGREHTDYWNDFDELRISVKTGTEPSVFDLIGQDYTSALITDEYFTEDERDGILAWFARHSYPGTTITATPLLAPLPGNLGPVDMAGAGGTADYYCFDEEPGFDCPVQFWGYFDVCGRPLIRPDGTLDVMYWGDEH